MKHPFRTLAAALALAAAPLLATAQPVPIVGLVELSGGGATVGTNFDNAVKLGVKEINAAGGLAGRKIEYTSFDTQTNPGIAKALAAKAVDSGAYVVMGPVFSGSIIVSMGETRKAEITNVVAGEAASLTQQGNPYVFRTSFTQTAAMPKVAAYIKDTVKAKTVAVIYVNDDFGKGGRDVITPEFDKQGVKVAADISTDPKPDRLFRPRAEGQAVERRRAVRLPARRRVGARLLRELRKQGYDKPIVGETTLVNEKVLELAGDAANGVVAHVGLTADAPNPTMQAFVKKFEAEYKYRPDHNAMKGYVGHLGGQGDDRQGRQDRHQGARRRDPRRHDLRQGLPRRADGPALRRQGRYRPRELLRQDRQRQGAGGADVQAGLGCQVTRGSAPA